MAYEIIDTPARNLSPGNVSYWLAAYNPNVFKYQRKDYVVIQAANAGLNTLSIRISTLLTTDEAAAIVDSFIRFKTDTYDVLSIQVVNADISSGTYTELIVENAPNNSASDFTTGFLNAPALNTRYTMVTKMFVGSAVIIAKHTPGIDGVTRADLSAYLQGFMTKQDDINYNIFNQVDNNAFVNYNVSIAEVYTQTDGTEVFNGYSYINQYWAVNASLQLGQGSNLAPYVPFSHEPNPAKLAKFLTLIKEPKLYLNYQRDIAFIISENVAGQALKVKYTTLDVNRQPIDNGLLTDVLMISDIDEMLINEIDNLLIADVSEYIAPLVSSNIGVNRLSLINGFSDLVKYLQFYIFYAGVPAAARFSWSLYQSAYPYVDGNLETRDNGGIVVITYANSTGSYTEPAGNTFNILLFADDGPAPSSVTWRNVQSAAPNPYVDSNLKIQDNGSTVVDELVNGSGAFSVDFGHSIVFYAYEQDPTTAVNPKLNMIVRKDGNIVFSKSKPYVAGGPGLTYVVTAGAGRTYDVFSYTNDGAADLPNINVTDVADHPKFKLTVKKNGSIIFNNVIDLVPGVGNGLSYGGIADIGANYEITAIADNNIAPVTPVNIPENPVVIITPAEVRLTEIKTLQVCCEPSADSAYLKCQNRLGGWDYFAFDYRVRPAIDISYDTYDVDVLDYETQRETQNVLTKSAQPKLTVGKSDISAEDIDGLVTLLTSMKVYYLIDKDNDIWRGVVIDSRGADLADTLTKRGDFEIDILLPTLNLQSASK